jgi:hypothetical protein
MLWEMMGCCGNGWDVVGTDGIAHRYCWVRLLAGWAGWAGRAGRVRMYPPHPPPSVAMAQQVYEQYERKNIPVVLTDQTDSWGAMASWTPEALARVAANIPFEVFDDHAGPVEMRLGAFLRYCSEAEGVDESPLYLFDADFCTKQQQQQQQQQQRASTSATATTAATKPATSRGRADGGRISAAEPTAVGAGGSFGLDYGIPSAFPDDFFEVLEEKRPDYKWLLVGAARTGAAFHVDPNATSAWNAVISGSKKWIMFPPSIRPPGVHAGGDVDASSVVDWFVR